MAQILVIGYGNPLRGDDALGWEVAQKLMEDEERPEVEVVASHQLTPELSESASEVKAVIFVDAACQGPAGTIEVKELQPSTKPPTTFSHHLTPDVLLTCSATLYGVCPKAYLVSVAGESFGYGEPMTPVIQEAFVSVVERVRELISQLLPKADTEKTEHA